MNLVPGERRVCLRRIVRYGLPLRKTLTGTEVEIHPFWVERTAGVAHRVQTRPQFASSP
jgi:hypothetical protein